MVFELARHRFVHLVQDAERGVAIGHGGDDDTETINVSHLGKAQMFLFHLLVDGVKRFLPACKAHFHAHFGKNVVHVQLYFLHQVTPPIARFLDGFAQCGMAPRMQVAKR